MSWNDALKGLLSEAEHAALPSLIERVLGPGGLQSILAKLQDAGFSAEVASWLDKNKGNLPITPEQLRAALGDEHVQQIARSLGIPLDAVAAALAKYLPEAVNAVGPAAAPPPA
ncbi:MAG: YidB family protein [Hyphomicrobium sp.]